MSKFIEGGARRVISRCTNYVIYGLSTCNIHTINGKTMTTRKMTRTITIAIRYALFCCIKEDLFITGLTFFLINLSTISFIIIASKLLRVWTRIHILGIFETIKTLIKS